MVEQRNPFPFPTPEEQARDSAWWSLQQGQSICGSGNVPYTHTELLLKIDNLDRKLNRILEMIEQGVDNEN